MFLARRCSIDRLVSGGDCSEGGRNRVHSQRDEDRLIAHVKLMYDMAMMNYF
jgi:hypothetical protein